MAPRRDLWSILALAAVGLVALTLPEWKPEPRVALRVAPNSHSGLPPRATDRQRRDPFLHGSPVPPWRIRWSDWKAILWGAYEKISDNRLLAVAAGVVFYCLLALFPALAAFVSIYGLISDPSTVNSHLALVSGVLPGGAVDILHEELSRLVANRSPALSFGLVISTLVALWSANAGVKSIIDGLNVAYERKETRSFVRLNLVAFGFTVGGIVAAVLALSMVVIAPVIFQFLGAGGTGDLVIQALRWPALLALVVLGLAVLYRFGPSGGDGRWRWLSVGAVTAAVLWLAASALFSWYIANFGNYNATYGSLGAAIGLMTWMWISMIVVLVGAELNAQIEQRTTPRSDAPGGASRGRR